MGAKDRARLGYECRQLGNEDRKVGGCRFGVPSRPWEDPEFFSEIGEPLVGSNEKRDTLESYFKRNILAVVQQRDFGARAEAGKPAVAFPLPLVRRDGLG